MPPTGQMCDNASLPGVVPATNPISAKPGSRGRSTAPNKPNSCRCADPEIGVPGGPSVQNKPNCPKRGTEVVSAVAGVGSPDIPVFHHSSPMPIVRNKANSSISDCGLRIADSERPAARHQSLRGRL